MEVSLSIIVLCVIVVYIIMYLQYTIVVYNIICCYIYRISVLIVTLILGFLIYYSSLEIMHKYFELMNKLSNSCDICFYYITLHFYFITFYLHFRRLIHIKRVTFARSKYIFSIVAVVERFIDNNIDIIV